MVHLAQSAWRNWWYLFTGAVMLWFAVAAIGVPDRLDSWRSSSHDETVAGDPVVLAPEDQPKTATAGPLQFSVVSFRIRSAKDSDTTGSPLNGVLTMEVKNTTEKDVKLTPGALRLEIPGGGSVQPTATKTIGISRHLSQLVPVTFPIQKSRPGVYKLIYNERVVYSGRPL